MTRKNWLLAGAGTLALALLLGWAFAPRPVAVELAEVTRGPFETTVDEDGKTRIAERYVVSAPLAGRLARITLREGDPVATNAPWRHDTAPAGALGRAHAARAARPRRRRQRQRAARRFAQRARPRRAGPGNERDEAQRATHAAGLHRTDQARDRPPGRARRRARTGSRRRRAAHRRARTGAGARGARRGIAFARRRRSGAGPRVFTVVAPVAGRVLRVLQASETTVALGTPLVELGDIARHRRSWPSC
ncbi:MAG: hypothetical protein U1F25_17230 [Rubrivivax sp.]